MEILQIVVITVFFICCAVLVFLIMIQSGKGGSLGIFGGASSSTAFGASTVDVITKATWYGTVAFFLLAIAAAVVFADLGPTVPIDAKTPPAAGQKAPGKTENKAGTAEKKEAPPAAGKPSGEKKPAPVK